MPPKARQARRSARGVPSFELRGGVGEPVEPEVRPARSPDATVDRCAPAGRRSAPGAGSAAARGAGQLSAAAGRKASRRRRLKDTGPCKSHSRARAIRVCPECKGVCPECKGVCPECKGVPNARACVPNARASQSASRGSSMPERSKWPARVRKRAVGRAAPGAAPGMEIPGIRSRYDEKARNPRSRG